MSHDVQLNVNPQTTTLVLHRDEPQGSVSVQHVPPSSQMPPPTQPPLFVPQGTVCPQLFVTVPQAWLPQASACDSGTHPQVCVVVLHVAPSPQAPQSMELPQLSFVIPQRPWHQRGGGTGSQQRSDWQTPPSPHAHVTGWPQLETVAASPQRDGVPQTTAGGCGEQHVPPSRQTSDALQRGPPATPQPTIWPQLFIAVPQFCAPHVYSTVLGTQPLHVPLGLHVCSSPHVPQFTDASQLSCVSPQRLLQKPGRT
jgi:hypothetical protein